MLSFRIWTQRIQAIVGGVLEPSASSSCCKPSRMISKGVLDHLWACRHQMCIRRDQGKPDAKLSFLMISDCKRKNRSVKYWRHNHTPEKVGHIFQYTERHPIACSVSMYPNVFPHAPPVETISAASQACHKLCLRRYVSDSCHQQHDILCPVDQTSQHD